MTRKEELQKELSVIEEKELSVKLKEMKDIEGSIDNKLKLEEASAHKYIMYGDFAIKLIVALFVSVAFMHVVYTGNVDAMSGDGALIGAPAGNGNFQLLSVLGPLFGLVLSYYFGKSKASANGE